jgi:hypothetical protein
MLTYADVLFDVSEEYHLADTHCLGDVCGRMLTYADVC